MKKCSKCKEVKSLTEFGPNRARPDGIAVTCKACRKLDYTANATKILEDKKDYYLKNREEKLAKAKNNYELNRDKKMREFKKYYLENREKKLAADKNRRDSNPEITKLRARDQRRKHLPKVLARNALRRAHIKRATPPWADLKMIEAAYIASDLLNQITGEWHHVDHIIPLRGKLVSGLHVHTNLRVLPGPENLSKSNKFEVI